MARSLLAEIGVLRRTHGGRDPDAALLVEHRVVDVVLAGPDHFLAPVRRRRGHLRRRRRRVRIANRQLDLSRLVAVGIEHRQVVGAQFERAVDRPVRVERGIAAIGRDDIVEVGLRIGPVPHRDDDVALEALRARRRRRHLSLGACDRSSPRRSRARAPARADSRPLIICAPACPDWMRRSHACVDASNFPSAAGISRVALLPS